MRKRQVHWKLFAGAIALAMAFTAAGQTRDAATTNPDNPKYLLFRDKPLVLISVSEHYSSLINRPFDFEKYLDDAATHNNHGEAHVPALSRTAERPKSVRSRQDIVNRATRRE